MGVGDATGMDVEVGNKVEVGGTLVLTDCLGRVVREKKMNAKLTELRLTDLSGGMYQLVYTVGGKHVQKSIVKH